MNGGYNSCLPSAAVLKSEAMAMKVEKNPEYTSEMFLLFYPPFVENVPASVLEMWVG